MEMVLEFDSLIPSKETYNLTPGSAPSNLRSKLIYSKFLNNDNNDNKFFK